MNGPEIALAHPGRRGSKGDLSMSETEQPAGPSKDYGLERLLMLSDGVFAIAITLMAIEVHPPEHWDGTWASLWAGSWQNIGAYIISFAVIGVYWMSHRNAFAQMRRADGVMAIFNLLSLGLIALLPAGTELIYAHGTQGAGVTVYTALVGGIGLAQALTYGYGALVGRMINPAVPVALRVITFLAMVLTPIGVVTAIFYGGGTGQWWIVGLVVLVILVVSLIRRRLAAPLKA